MITGKAVGAEDPWCNLTLHGQSLAEVTSIKVLGVHISNMLGWPDPILQLNQNDGSIVAQALPETEGICEWPLLSEKSRHPLVDAQIQIGTRAWRCTRVSYISGRRVASLVSHKTPFLQQCVDITAVRELWR